MSYDEIFDRVSKLVDEWASETQLQCKAMEGTHNKGQGWEVPCAEDDSSVYGNVERRST